MPSPTQIQDPWTRINQLERRLAVLESRQPLLPGRVYGWGTNNSFTGSATAGTISPVVMTAGGGAMDSDHSTYTASAPGFYLVWGTAAPDPVTASDRCIVEPLVNGAAPSTGLSNGGFSLADQVTPTTAAYNNSGMTLVKLNKSDVLQLGITSTTASQKYINLGLFFAYYCPI